MSPRSAGVDWNSWTVVVATVGVVVRSAASSINKQVDRVLSQHYGCIAGVPVEQLLVILESYLNS